MSIKETLRVIELEREVYCLRMRLSYIKTYIRDILVTYEDGEEDEAIRSLRDLVEPPEQRQIPPTTP